MPFLPRLSNLIPTFLMMLLVILGMNPGIAVAQLRCYDCHGTRSTGDYRPLDAPTRDINTGGFAGNHRTHMAPGATAASCNPCHYALDAVPAFYSSHHRDRRIQVAENINNSPHPDKAGYYRNGEKAVFFNQTAVPLPGSCENVNCHFETVTPEWGDTLLTREACTGCHGAPPSYGAHVKHSAFLGAGTTSCSRCHNDHPSEADPLAHARQAGSRSLYIRFSGAANSGGSYNAGNETEYPNYLPSQHPTRNGICTTLYCHSNGKGSLVASPPWSSGLTLGCNGCHGTGATTGAPDYANGGEGAALANSHPGHMYSGRIICADCHIGTTATGTSIVAGSTLHINSRFDVTFKDGGSYDKQPKNCSNTLCHSTAVPVWGGALPADCTGCHGGNAVSASAITTGKHTAHMNNRSTLGRGNNLGCAECHASTVDSDRHISNQLSHFNKLKDYSGAKAGRIITAGSGRCSNSYCHSSGNRENQYWDMSSSGWDSGANFSCSGCHGTLTLPDGTFQAYTSVAGEPSYPNTGVGTPLANSHQKHVVGSQDDTTGCSRCHRSTGDATIAGKLRDYSTVHLDRQRNVDFAAAIQGRYSATSQQCLNLYCHSNGEPFDNSTAVYLTATWGDSNSTNCGSCHGDTASADTLSGRHGKHTTSTIYESSCDRCHANTLNADGSLKNKKLHANRIKDIAFREGGTYNTATKGCGSATYCHSDATSSSPPWGTATTDVKWSDKNNEMTCFSCHKGRSTRSTDISPQVTDNTEANCNALQGVWSSAKGYCTPDLVMSSNGHHRLVGSQWIRKYPCNYCHRNTVTLDGTLTNISSIQKHVNGKKDVVIDSKWSIMGRDPASYDPSTKVCSNVYCHSDGTPNPAPVKPYAWTEPEAKCNSCHGHPRGGCDTIDCHGANGIKLPDTYKVGETYDWPAGQTWKAAVPMFVNPGAMGSPQANSHSRHVTTEFTCDECHYKTINQSGGACNSSGCHPHPDGTMGDSSHLDAAYHVNKKRDVFFKQGGDYTANRTCTDTACHTGITPPTWGDTVKGSVVICMSCHQTNGPDVDDFTIGNKIQGKINIDDWKNNGHGRYSSMGRYPGSNNPAANFPKDSPCGYCHDNNILHNDPTNPLRVHKHQQFEQRFEKECVYCHMTAKTNAECLACHKTEESLAPQLANIPAKANATWANRTTTVMRPDHTLYSGYSANDTTCLTTACHFNDSTTHNTGSPTWSKADKADVKNQYVMMGVCLKCHDDDSNNQCGNCHEYSGKYLLGFDGGVGKTIKPKKAKATSSHFGYKHYREYVKSGTWKGGKFCWDCHDPHGDSNLDQGGVSVRNIYMIQSEVALTTEGTFGIPNTAARARVRFTKKENGADYARQTPAFDGKFDGICNVCHAADNKYYRYNGGSTHNSTRICTTCHEHRFADSHGSGKACNSCHQNKPVPRHGAFSLPRDCTKCHAGVVGNRTDVMSQLNDNTSNSHHIQGVTPTNEQCYVCHWEATPEGLINTLYHEGFNFRRYTSVKNAKVDLVIWGARYRPTRYSNNTTAIQFMASKMGNDDAGARRESQKLNGHCIGCHSDQNNDTQPFKDCKTPRQYAWDGQSVAARYSQTDTTSWGKNSANNKGVSKAFSAHGQAKSNQGGWTLGASPTINYGGKRNGPTGYDENYNSWSINYSINCYDCHNSHGSRTAGVTSSYKTFNGTKNGGNLKETQINRGGYTMSYKASSNSDAGAINPYNAGAGQCFDCHISRNSKTAVTNGATPWGYFSTFAIDMPIMGVMDTERFAVAGTPGYMQLDSFKQKSMKGGHFKSTLPVIDTANMTGSIDGLCTPCHDPHGVSPTLGSKQAYAVPLLKGTWLTSPYKIETAPVSAVNPPKASSTPSYFNGTVTVPGTVTANAGLDVQIDVSPTLDEKLFAGLCLNCHKKSSLENNINNDKPWKSVDRIHESVAGWAGAGNTTPKHQFPCSKCHAAHVSSLPRLMVTNCLDTKHRGRVASGGLAGSGSLYFAGNPFREGFYGPASSPLSTNKWGSYPSGRLNSQVPCHSSTTDNSWNSVTPW